MLPVRKECRLTVGCGSSALRWTTARAEFAPVCRESCGHRRCAGCGWGEFFLGGVVRGLGIEAVLDRVWCFCVIFKFIFGVFWIIIIEKDGWPDWLIDI